MYKMVKRTDMVDTIIVTITRINEGDIILTRTMGNNGATIETMTTGRNTY